MSENRYDATDPLFLLSKSLDEVLTAEERERLDQAIVSGRVTQAEIRDWRATHVLLGRWASKTGDVLVANLEPEVLRRVQSQPDDEALDGLLSGWGHSEPEVDWDYFHGGVMREVRALRLRQRRPAVWLRIGLPLAAAAAVVFAAMISLRTRQVESSRVVVRIGLHAAGERVVAGSDVRTTVSFGRVSVGPEMMDRPAAGISSGWGGPSPGLESAPDVPPL